MSTTIVLTALIVATAANWWLLDWAHRRMVEKVSRWSEEMHEELTQAAFHAQLHIRASAHAAIEEINEKRKDRPW
jgi:ABC-type protease/lipase transport system fused ATPase/permease subunit